MGHFRQKTLSGQSAGVHLTSIHAQVSFFIQMAFWLASRKRGE
jgi:hypothetical protein